MEVTLSQDAIEKILKFAQTMAYGGHHREFRSGGTIRRNPQKVFFDVALGKFGEKAVATYLETRQSGRCSDLDLKVMGRGAWDDFDFIWTSNKNNKDYHISVKSAKHFSQYLLLEREAYIHHNGPVWESLEKEGFTFLSLVNIENVKKICEGMDLSDPGVIDDIMKKYPVVTVTIAGFMKNESVKEHLAFQEQTSEYLKKGAEFKKTKMDADNYFLKKSDLIQIPPPRQPVALGMRA